MLGPQDRVRLWKLWERTCLICDVKIDMLDGGEGFLVHIVIDRLYESLY